MKRRATVIIMVLLAAAVATLRARAQDDVANIPSADKTVADQPNQRYFLIGDAKREPPVNGFGLLLVLPGGDGAPSSTRS